MLLDVDVCCICSCAEKKKEVDEQHVLSRGIGGAVREDPGASSVGDLYISIDIDRDDLQARLRPVGR